MRTHLIHRPARDIFPPLGGARKFSPIVFDLPSAAFMLAATACSRVPAELGAINPDAVHDMTASRRASATIAFFIPRRLAICIAQALSEAISSNTARPGPLRRA